MTSSKNAFAILKGKIAGTNLDNGVYDELLAAVEVAERAANDERADAFAEGRYATLEKVVSVNALSPVGPNYL